MVNLSSDDSGYQRNALIGDVINLNLQIQKKHCGHFEIIFEFDEFDI